MNTTEAAPSSFTAIPIPDPPAVARGNAPLLPPPARNAPLLALFRKTKSAAGSGRGLAVFDFILRLCAIGASVAAAVAMGTSDETLPFVTEHYQFYASYADLPALPFFVIGNGIAAGYLVLSLPLSIFTIVLPQAAGARFLLFFFDLVMLVLTTAAGAAATGIVVLAHTGNGRANWVEICLRFDGFCQQISGAVVASFVAVFLLLLMVLLSAVSLARRHHGRVQLLAKN